MKGHPMDVEPGAESPAICPRCKKTFGCGARAEGCWCEALPVLVSPDPAKGCYCPACLRLLAAPAPAATANN